MNEKPKKKSAVAPEITEYDLAFESGLDAFVGVVNEAIKNGWRPVGGVFVSAASGKLYQAMVR